MNIRNNTKKENTLITQLIIGGFIIGLLLGIYFIFTIISAVTDVPDGQQKFAYVHSANKSLFIAWSLPFVFGFIARYFAFVFIKKKKEYDRNIDTKNNIITNNALFAKSIGEGDFDKSDFGALNKQDLLTRSLIIMRKNLVKNKDIEQKNIWINEGKEIISIELRKNLVLKQLSYHIIKKLIDYCGLIQGRLYIWDDKNKHYKLNATYAYERKKFASQSFKLGEGLIGQSAYEKQSIYRTEIPNKYTSITSGLIQDKKPGSIFIMPLISEQKVQGIIEVANIDNNIPKMVRDLIENIGPIIGQVLFSVRVNQKTEKLLSESQVLTEELRENEEELQQNAEEMRMTHEELEKSNEELEHQVQEVESSKTRLHSLLENASEIITIFDAKGKIKYESPSTEKILGYNHEDVINKSATHRIVKEYIPIVKQNFIELHKNQYKIVNYEFKHLKKDGSEIWMETTGRNMLDNPAIQGLIFNTRDITLQRIAEKDRRLKSQMQALSENSPDLIIRFGKKGKFHYSNPKIKDYFGFTPAEIQGKRLNEIEMNDDHRDFFLNQINNTVSVGKKSEIEFEMNTLDGNKIFKISNIPEFSDEKELETILFIAHDLTEIKAIEKEITHKNQKLTESINYAQRIQNAILPKEDILSYHFKDSFIFYKARDVVSGDFPWFKKTKEGIYLAAVDCTGHGVPGALLSFIGYFLLNDIVSSNPGASSAKILDIFDKEVKQTLKQDNGSRNTRDGMDIALCKFSLDMKKLNYAGAHRPLYIQRGEELIQITGDRRAIGGITPKKKRNDFKHHCIDLQQGDRIFIFSDGLSDQFKEGSLAKFQEKQVRQIISENRNTAMSDLQAIFENRISLWQGNYRQIDDILLIGIEI